MSSSLTITPNPDPPFKKFPLLKLPILAQVNILSTMAPSAVYFLTALSQCRKVARVVKWNDYQSSLVILRGYIGLFLWNKSDELDAASCVTVTKIVERIRNAQSYNLDGKKKLLFRIAKHDELDIPTISYVRRDTDMACNTIINHFQSTFRVSTFSQCTVGLQDLHRIPKDLLLNQLLVQEDKRRGNYILKKEEVDHFFDTHPVPEIVHIVPEQDGDISSNKKLMSVKNLTIHNATWASQDNISKLTGQDILLTETSLTTQDVIAFVKHWLNGGYENLDTMWWMANANNFDIDEIINEFELDVWDKKRRAKTYTKVVENRKLRFDLYDCTQCFDIERESDGRLASIDVFGNYFMFYVWRERFPKNC